LRSGVSRGVGVPSGCPLTVAINVEVIRSIRSLARQRRTRGVRRGLPAGPRPPRSCERDRGGSGALRPARRCRALRLGTLPLGRVPDLSRDWRPTLPDLGGCRRIGTTSGAPRRARPATPGRDARGRINRLGTLIVRVDPSVSDPVHPSSPQARPVPSPRSTGHDPERWRREARCRDRAMRLFFAPEVASVAEAKSVCGACAVRADCLAYALADRSLCGVWGGTTERERERARRHA
jgi:WhiB family transcriptional regulator, redox-sensing transcriptional regulator